MLTLIDYGLNILPGLLLLGGLYFLYKGRQAIAFRIFLLILAFMLMRDAMTAHNLWELGIHNGVLWIRFVDDPFVLVSLGLASLVFAVLVLVANKQMKPYLKWGKLTPKTLLYGLLGAGAIATPLLIAYQFTPLAERGGSVALGLLPALLAITLLGNFMEELLFRGYLQGYLEKLYKPLLAALLSTLTFASAHIFLAFIATDIGIALLIFTLYEGLVCAFLRMRYGLWPAVVAHGVGVFVVVSGM